jgi:hypothetical protein
MFGTLYVPGAAPEKLEFGVEPDRPHAHTIKGELFAPFGRAAAMLAVWFERRPKRDALGAVEQRRA